MKLAIVGAGLVGRLLAWRLNEFSQQQSLDIKITLIEEKDLNFFGTGLIAAAMVAPFTEAVNSEAITKVLGMRSYQLWGKWLPKLEGQTGKVIAFNKKGTLLVSHPQDDSDWQRFVIKVKHVVPEDKLQFVENEALQKLEPELANSFSKGLFFAGEGVVNNLALYPALNAYFTQSQDIQVIENTKITALTNNAYIAKINQQFDHVFDCRGNGAKAELKQFRSVRGEVARVYAPEVNISRAIRLIHPRFPLYIAPRDNHEYIIGATQIESDIDTPVTIRSGLELLSALYSLHEGFGEAQIIDFLVGLRPTLIDNLPRVETNEKLTRINGLYRHGYLFAPALISDVLDVFQQEVLVA
ncbi:MAG TPA: FAD-dependent oxidoreductase [Leucothrix sp.]|nr:FAD-dependent oxidoreductase [Leucothrix sp.]